MSLVFRLFGPLMLWLAGFSAVYALHGLVCSQRWPLFGLTQADGRLALVAAWVALIAVQVGVGWMLLAQRGLRREDILCQISLWLSGVAIVASVWSLFPIVVTSPCG